MLTIVNVYQIMAKCLNATKIYKFFIFIFEGLMNCFWKQTLVFVGNNNGLFL